VAVIISTMPSAASAVTRLLDGWFLPSRMLRFQDEKRSTSSRRLFQRSDAIDDDDEEEEETSDDDDVSVDVDVEAREDEEVSSSFPSAPVVDIVSFVVGDDDDSEFCLLFEDSNKENAPCFPLEGQKTMSLHGSRH
jgi:hypothetical protein